MLARNPPAKQLENQLAMTNNVEQELMAFMDIPLICLICKEQKIKKPNLLLKR